MGWQPIIELEDAEDTGKEGDNMDHGNGPPLASNTETPALGGEYSTTPPIQGTASAHSAHLFGLMACVGAHTQAFLSKHDIPGSSSDGVTARVPPAVCILSTPFPANRDGSDKSATAANTDCGSSALSSD